MKKKEKKQRNHLRGAAIGAGVVAGVLVLFMLLNVFPLGKIVKGTNGWIKPAGSRPLISAHRGGAAYNPENTRMAFDWAADQPYVDVLETDIHKTKDGAWVIIHDDTVDRLVIKGWKDGDEATHYVHDLTLAELKAFNLGTNFTTDGGEHYPYRDLAPDEIEAAGLSMLTVEEFLSRYLPKGKRAFLEIKEKGDIAKECADMLNAELHKDEYRAWLDEGRVTIISFDNPVISYMAVKYPDLYVSPLGTTIAAFFGTAVFGFSAFYKPDYQVISFPYQYAKILVMSNPTVIRVAHKRNMAVVYWTVDNEDWIKDVALDGGDVITTNVPTKVNEVLTEIYGS